MLESAWRKFVFTALVASLAGCSSDSGSDNTEPENNSVAAQGESQKGPFQQGAGVTARDILADGTIGTESASTSTSDERGSYQFDTLSWQGPSRVRIEGTFYNEVSGTLSSESRYLDSILSAGEAGENNINVYTHIKSARIQTLMGTGQSFSAARSQADQEWQGFVGTQTPARELNILENTSGQAGADNANLLLFSAAVLQAGLDQQALDSLRDDFADDGDINGTAEPAYQSVVSAGQNPDLLADARSNLTGEFGGEPATGNPSDFAWLPGVCEQTKLNVSNRQVLCSGGESLPNLNRSSPGQADDERIAAALVFESAGHYRVEVAGVSGKAFNGNNWKLFRFDDQDTSRLCDNSTETSQGIGSSVIEDLTDRMDPDERKCLGVYYAPSPDNGGAQELSVGLIPVNDGSPSLSGAVPLSLSETFNGKIGNYVTTASDFPAYSYYQFDAPVDGTYRITVDGYDNLGSGSMRISLFADTDNSGGITFLNDQERLDFTGGPGTASTETVMEKDLSAGTYAVRIFNGTGYRATMEGAAFYLTGIEMNILVEGP